MNVTFTGYMALTCNGCKTTRNIESKTLTFERDTSPEAEDDSYIRYLTHIDTACSVCSEALHINLDVWEYPEAVTNYSYYGEQGVHDVQCEFTIDHYFDDKASNHTMDEGGGMGAEGETTTLYSEDVSSNGGSHAEEYEDHYDDAD